MRLPRVPAVLCVVRKEITEEIAMSPKQFLFRLDARNRRK